MLRLLPYWRNARTETALGGGVLIFAAAVELLQPWPVKWLIDYVFGSQPMPAWLKSLWPDFATASVGGGITWVGISILLLALVFRAGTLVGQFFLIRAGARIVQKLRCTACDHLHRLSLSYHDRTKVGDSLYRVAYDAHSAQTLFNGAVVPIFTGTLLLVGATAVMFQINLWLTLVTLIVTPAFFLIIRIFGRKIDQHSRRYHESESALVSSLQESLGSIRAIQAFTLEPDTSRRFREQTEQGIAASRRMTLTQLIYAASSGLTASLGTVGVVWVAGYQVMQGRLTVGDILVFLAYLGMMYQPLHVLSQSASVIQSSRAQLRRVFEILDAQPEIQDQPAARTLPAVRGEIEFRDVSFHYDADRPVLSGVNLRVQPGQTVAIVGRTGAGKSTIASLLMRFYDPSGGSIRLDGHDLRELRVSWLRQQVGLVLQEPVLFSTTIAENIANGRAGASLEEIQNAAKLAHADEFIRELPRGYDTLLGDRGVNLSGGQRQRRAIARAFLKNAPILVLDDPTSALDAHTEGALVASLRALMQGRTTFVIAHRLSTVRHADIIVVIEDGKILEHGSHSELLAEDSAYRKLYEAQWGEQAEPGDSSPTRVQ